MMITIRRAVASEQDAIRKLVRSEKLNPTDLDWRNFVVAHDWRGLAGAVQLRFHADGSCELGSLVVRPDARKHGIAARMIDALLADAHGRVLMITGEQFEPHYARWGFHRIKPEQAPPGIRRHYFLGRLGGILSWLKQRPVTRLVILDRATPAKWRKSRM